MMPKNLCSRTALACALAAATMLGAAPSQAQPSRRERRMLTPKLKLPPGLAGARRGAKAGKAPARGSVKSSPKGRGGKSGSGSVGSGGGVGSAKLRRGPDGRPDISTAPDIAYRPLRSGARVNFNLADADLQQLVETIANYTGRRFIFGGKLRQIKATIVSPKPVTVYEAYQAFLSILEAHGMTVVPHGRYLKIVETAGVVGKATPIYGVGRPVPYEDRVITRMYRLKHVDANDVSTVLNKFKSKSADITVYAPGNLLIITDTGRNIRRMLRVVEELDAGGAGEQIWMQPIHYIPAADLATKLGEVLDGGEGNKARVLSEERSNTLIIVATESDYLRMLELVKRIDVPSTSGGGGIHVLPLQHAQCDELSQVVGNILGSGGGGGGARRSSTRRGGSRGRSSGRRSGSSGARASSSAAGDGGVFDGEVRISCDPATNSMVTVSSLRDYARLRAVIDKLDRPRRQVFIEAVIMDVNVDHTSEFGLGFHGGATAGLGGGSDTIFYGGSNPGSSITGVPSNLEALAFGVRGPDLEGSSTLLGTGVSIPGFGVVLHALARSGDSNVLATPHILATDNIAAEISIGQNIPLQTNVGGGLGQLAGLAGAAGGAAGGAGALGGLGGLLGGGLGFQAPRSDVGIKLKIVPHINDSDQVRMEISEEFSDAGSPTGAIGAVPINKRTADTTVIVRDQQTVVIGGLVREGQVNGITKVPVLGDIPVLGALFRTTSKTTQKTNLLLVLTPHIVRDQSDLRRIFERKMQERQEFLDRYFIFDDTMPWEPAADYARTNGMVEHIRQTQLAAAERDRLAAEIRPEGPKGHEPVQPVALPSVAQKNKKPVSSSKRRRSTTRPRGRTSARNSKNRRKFKIPGGRLRNSRRYRIE
jgi:general secretion pathway protein D